MADLQQSSRRDVVFSTSELSSIIEEEDLLDRRISGVIGLSFGTDDIRLRTGCALSRTGCTYGRASSSCFRASSTCCHASQHTAAHRKDLFCRYCTFVMRGKILNLLLQISE